MCHGGRRGLPGGLCNACSWCRSMSPPLAPSDNPCELHCRPSNSSNTEKLRDAVVDGTPCYQSRISRDICLNGICKVCGRGGGSPSPAGRPWAHCQGFLAFSRLHLSPCCLTFKTQPLCPAVSGNGEPTVSTNLSVTITLPTLSPPVSYCLSQHAYL